MSPTPGRYSRFLARKSKMSSAPIRKIPYCVSSLIHKADSAQRALLSDPLRNGLKGDPRMWQRCAPPKGLFIRSRGFGVVVLEEKPERKCYYLRMVWFRGRGGQWYGEWRWLTSDGEDEHPGQGMADLAARQSRGRHGTMNVPIEVLLLVCDHATYASYPQKTEFTQWLHDWRGTKGTQQLRNLALVCRAARDVCARTLYRSLVIDPADASKFVMHVGSRAEAVTKNTSTRVEAMSKHTRRIILRGDCDKQLWSACIKLAPRTIFPRMVALSLQCSLSGEGPNSHNSPFYPPFCPHLLPVLRSVASGIICLQLQDCSFMSSLDLLRVLGSFPSLQDARLHRVSCMAQGRSATYLPPSTRSTRLDYLLVEKCPCPFDLVCALVAAWRSVRSPRCSRFPLGFPGIEKKDAQMMMNICQCLRITSQAHENSDSSGSVHLDSSCDPQEGWVAWLFCRYFHVEFHLASGQQMKDSEGCCAVARVQHVLLRLRSFRTSTSRRSEQPQISVEDYLAGGLASLDAIDFFLSQLPAMESFVLETDEEPLRSSFATLVSTLVSNGHNLQVLGDDTKTHTIRCRSQAEAHSSRASKRSVHGASSNDSNAYAQSVPGSVTASLMSPFWFHEDYKNQQAPWLKADRRDSFDSLRVENGAQRILI